MDSKTKHTLEVIYILLIAFTPVPYNPLNLLFAIFLLLFCFWVKYHRASSGLAYEFACQQVILAEACAGLNAIGIFLATIFKELVGINLFSLDFVNTGMMGLQALMATVILLGAPAALLTCVFDGLISLHDGHSRALFYQTRQLDVYVLAFVAMVAKIAIVCVTDVHYIEMFTF